MERLLVADIGGSSSRWAVVPERGEARIIEGVQGHNPAIGDGEAFVVALRDRFAKEKDLLDARRVIVYGAGCGTIERQARMHALLKPLFVAASIEVNNDLLGTARGLCGDKKGLVLILGTGMNAGYFDGSVLRQPMPSLGYVLGDEGSGADLGKQVLRDALYGKLPLETRAELFPEGLDVAGVIEGAYRSARPQAYLASFALNVAEHIDDAYVYGMVLGRFRALAELICAFFPPEQRKRMYATGSVAFGLQDVLGPCLAEHGMTLTAVQRDPMPGLARFHQKHWQ